MVDIYLLLGSAVMMRFFVFVISVPPLCGDAVMLYFGELKMNGLNNLKKNNHWSSTRSIGSLAEDGMTLIKKSSNWCGSDNFTPQ